jgi:hypothetical protein
MDSIATTDPNQSRVFTAMDTAGPSHQNRPILKLKAKRADAIEGRLFAQLKAKQSAAQQPIVPIVPRLSPMTPVTSDYNACTPVVNKKRKAEDPMLNPKHFKKYIDNITTENATDIFASIAAEITANTATISANTAANYAANTAASRAQCFGETNKTEVCHQVRKKKNILDKKTYSLLRFAFHRSITRPRHLLLLNRYQIQAKASQRH